MDDSAGKYSRGWGSGLFGEAHSLGVDVHGNDWVTGNSPHGLRKFPPQGGLLAEHEKRVRGGAAADGTGSDSRDRIGVANRGSHRVQVLRRSQSS